MGILEVLSIVLFRDPNPWDFGGREGENLLSKREKKKKQIEKWEKGA